MFTLPALPYAYDALQPTMSDKTLHHHHDKHHAKYIDTLNGLLADKPDWAGLSLEEVVKRSKGGEPKIFNQAAQAWNHGFFWESMSAGAAKPTGELAAAIDAAFGSLAGLKEAFVKEGVGHFASGWVWLVAEGDTLKVISTHDADSAIAGDAAPLIVADLWEHAYYLDYQQDRAGFLGAWFDTIANWDFAAKQFAARGDQGAYRFPAASSAKAA